MSDIPSLIIELWPYAGDGKYDRRLKMLDSDARATMDAGVSSRQVEVAIEEVAKRASGFSTAIPLLHARLDGLRESERVREQRGARVYTQSDRPAATDGPLPPWRQAGLTLPEWLDREGGAGFDTLEGLCGRATAEAARALHARGRLRRSDVANAVAIGNEMGRAKASFRGGAE